MKKSQKLLSGMGLVGAPLVLSLLSATVPKISLVFFSFLFLGAGPVALSLGLLLILGATLAPLVLGRQDPTFAQFVLALL